jgi:hypothetical protein
MAINPDRLKEVMGSANVARSATPPDDIRGVAVNKAAPDLLDASLRLLRLLDAPQDIPVLTPLIEGKILYRLLTGPFGPRLRQIAITETPSNRLAAAIAWPKENFMRPLRIEELAAVRSEMTSLRKRLFDLGLEFLRAERLYDKAANTGLSGRDDVRRCQA